MAFSNLTVEEIRLALNLFCNFINEQTYVFFYFNGHALGGHGSDIYLVGKDSNLNGENPMKEQLVWHGEIEMTLDKRRPLFATIIYDSCRDQLPESVVHLVNETSRQNEPIRCESNFCIGKNSITQCFEFFKQCIFMICIYLVKIVIQTINYKTKILI